MSHNLTNNVNISLNHLRKLSVDTYNLWAFSILGKVENMPLQLTALTFQL